MEFKKTILVASVFIVNCTLALLYLVCLVACFEIQPVLSTEDRETDISEISLVEPSLNSPLII